MYGQGQHRDGNGGVWRRRIPVGRPHVLLRRRGVLPNGSANELRSARRFSRISDLPTTLAASSAFLPLVTFSGRAGSDTSITGEQSGQEAAIVVNDVTQIYLKKQKSRKDVKEYIVVKKTKEKDATEHLLLKNKENDDPEQWIRCSEEICLKRREDDGTGRLEIVRDRSTDGSVLCLASEDFEKQPRSCGCECSIKAVKDESGNILIQRPTNGGPFHVSRVSIDKIISNLGSGATWSKIWAATFAASGALLLGVGGYAATC